MEIAYFLLWSLIIILTLLPLSRSQHWIFRVPDFGKVQLMISCLIVFLLAFAVKNTIAYFWAFQLGLIAVFVYHAIVIFRYTSLFPIEKKQKTAASSHSITIVSCNIYQFNKEKNRFIDLIKKYNPSIFLTIESDESWEKEMRVLEKDYPYTHKISLDNTYGMHLYANVKMKEIKEHYFVADDIPSIEAHFITEDKFEFVIFAVHPPPPSPTEEETSKERDGELMSVAKRIAELQKPVVVIGDFNNVAWAKTSVLFRKAAELIDPRIGRGLLATFHAKYKLFRFPIDHIFHTADIFVEKINTLEHVGSDHFPLYCKFWIDKQTHQQEEEVTFLDTDENTEVDELIQEGKEEEGDRSKYE